MPRLTTFALLGLLATSPAIAAGDSAAGQVVFKKCAVCHNIGPGALPKIGPELNGLVGRAAGSTPNFNYSAAMKASGLTWDEATLAVYLKAPKNLVPGTKMTFGGLSSDQDIANLIAYLAGFAPDGTPKAPQ